MRFSIISFVSILAFCLSSLFKASNLSLRSKIILCAAAGSLTISSASFDKLPRRSSRSLAFRVVMICCICIPSISLRVRMAMGVSSAAIMTGLRFPNLADWAYCFIPTSQLASSWARVFDLAGANNTPSGPGTTGLVPVMKSDINASRPLAATRAVPMA